MRCFYCIHYAESTRRLKAKESEDERIPARRLCSVVKEWKTDNDEPCKDFAINGYFWCKKLRQNMSPKACNAKHKSKTRTCNHCYQHEEVVESMRFSSFVNKEVVVYKPVIKRRAK